MKKLILICLFFGSSLYGISQNAFYDAATISKRLTARTDTAWSFSTDTSATSALAGILRNYLPAAIPNRSSLKTGQILSLFADNPFFGNQIDVLNQGVQSPFIAKTIRSALSAVSNLDVTNIADGLARFLIKRGKQELSIAFFQRLKDFLDNNVEARTLFPATSKFLGNILAFQYSEFLQALREAFYKDVSNLIVNLNLLIDLPKYQHLLLALPEVRLAVRSAKIVSELSQPGSSLHPANLISRFAALTEWGEMNINLASSWKVLDKISESVRKVNCTTDTVTFVNIDTIQLTRTDSFVRATQVTKNIVKLEKIPANGMFRIDSTTKETYTTNCNEDIAWIRFSDFQQNILSDSITLKIYLGLLYQKMEGITFRYALNRDTSVQQFMADNRYNILRISDLIENFLVLANDVENSIEDIRGKKGEGFANDDYYTYIQKAIDVVDYGFKVANTIKEGIADDRYIVMARNADDLYKNIYTKNYNAAIMNAYAIIKEIMAKSKDAVAEKKVVVSNGSATSASSREAVGFRSAAAMVDNDGFLAPDSVAKRTKLVEEILKYGNVMAGIVKAQAPEEAEAAIEAAVLPAGSSSIKKNAAWNVSLNAYIGGYFARNVNSADKIDGNSSRVGVTAPVGIAFSKGLGYYKNGASAGSLSLYGTLIDVGAVAGYRLSNDSSALEQKVTLGDIFTPGGYLVYGIGLPFKAFAYVPLSVGYGWQYGAKLYYRKNDGKLALSGASRWRSNWFIAVDIPLANFWTKQYRKK